MKDAKALKALHALSQESRLAVYRLLLELNGAGMSAGEISTKLNIPPTTMSFHLSQLKNSELVSSRKEGRSVIYSIELKKVKRLTKFLAGKDLRQEDTTIDAKYEK